MMYMFRFLVLLSLVSAVVCERMSDSDDVKRLLLNDPNVLHSQIVELQRQMLEISTKYKEQEVKFQAQEIELLSQKNKNLVQDNLINNFTSYIQSQERTIYDLNTRVTQAATKDGAIFVRWGKHFCPDNDTELVYSGFVGGSHYSHTGAAAEYVCLSPDPNYVSSLKGTVTQYALMYGGEYDTNAFGPDDGEDIPCAVCRSKSTVSTLMIPGSNHCTPGWRMQYSGYLAASDYNFKAASQYICLDQNPEVVIHGHDNHEGKLVHPVKAECGALACPPYVDGKFLTCAVCSK